MNRVGDVGDAVRRVGVHTTSFSLVNLIDYNKIVVWLDLRKLNVESLAQLFYRGFLEKRAREVTALIKKEDNLKLP